MDEEFDYLYKIVLVGDQGVGKTHILSRYIKNALPKNPQSTIGVEFATSTVPLQTGGTVKAQIWDTAGQERYHAIVSAHYRRAVGALLVYDVTNHKTFQNTRRWIEELKKNAEPEIVIMLVGNKVDLCERNPIQRRVGKEEALAFADSQGLLFQETSALTSYKVREAFESLLQEIYNKSQSVRFPDADLAVSRLVPPMPKVKRPCCV